VAKRYRDESLLAGLESGRRSMSRAYCQALTSISRGTKFHAILEPVPTKEIAEAVLSASSAIASLLLVFIAFLFTKADALPPESKTVADRYVLYARAGIIPILSCVVGMLSSY